MKNTRLLTLICGTFLILALQGLSLTTSGQTKKAAGTLPEYTVLNPRGLPKDVERVAISPRLASLSGKTVYLVGQKGAQQRPLPQLTEALTKALPDTKFVLVGKAGFFATDEPKLFDQVAKNADAVIYGVGD